MTHDEYKEKLKQLEETYQKEKKQLAVKYAMSSECSVPKKHGF